MAAVVVVRIRVRPAIRRRSGDRYWHGRAVTRSVVHHLTAACATKLRQRVWCRCAVLVQKLGHFAERVVGVARLGHNCVACVVLGLRC